MASALPSIATAKLSLQRAAYSSELLETLSTWRSTAQWNQLDAHIADMMNRSLLDLSQKKADRTLLTLLVDEACRQESGFTPAMKKLMLTAMEVRDSNGRTPLLHWAWQRRSYVTSGLQLLQLGADSNAQDNEGRSVLHLLVGDWQLKTLQQLGKEGWLANFDFSLQNHAAESVLKAAQSVRQRMSGQGASEREGTAAVLDFIQAEVNAWEKNVRPAIQQEVVSVLIPDVASMIMQYVDGSDEFKDGSSSSSK